MVRLLVFVSLLLTVLLAAQVSQAQLFRGNAAPPAAREPARVGLLGGIREAREERFRREEQAAAAARAAATRAPATRGAAETANPAPKTANTASKDALRRNATSNSSSTSPAQKADANARTANFRGPSSVTQASASSFVPAPVDVQQFEGRQFQGQQFQGQQFQGLGVVIRLPKEARKPVNFLINETTTSAIRPGEEQVLDAKDNYVIRYSRGITRDGRSFGESRYKISEGRYRFELTGTGWELYREPDSDNTLAPPNPVDLVDNPANASDYAELLLPQPSSQSELQPIPANLQAAKLDLILSQPPSAPVRGQSVKGAPTPAEPAAKQPTTGVPAANEEVLPAPKPRSILE